MTDNANNKYYGMSMAFQTISFVVVALGILSVNPLQLGFQFLEKLPNKFECIGEDGSWKPCTRAHICSHLKDETIPKSNWNFNGKAY